MGLLCFGFVGSECTTLSSGRLMATTVYGPWNEWKNLGDNPVLMTGVYTYTCCPTLNSTGLAFLSKSLACCIWDFSIAMAAAC